EMTIPPPPGEFAARLEFDVHGASSNGDRRWPEGCQAEAVSLRRRPAPQRQRYDCPMRGRACASRHMASHATRLFLRPDRFAPILVVRHRGASIQQRTAEALR